MGHPQRNFGTAVNHKYDQKHLDQKASTNYSVMVLKINRKTPIQICGKEKKDITNVPIVS